MNLLQTIQYYIAYYTLQEPATKQLIMIAFFAALLLFVSSCATEYRSELEIARGVVLTEEQIESRKAFRSETLRLQQREDREKQFREALRQCSVSNQPIAVCL